MKFKPNDIVKCSKHTRLMGVEKYRKTERSISYATTDTPVVVTEGGYYHEDELTLVFRKERR